MRNTTQGVGRIAACATLAFALMAAGCNGNRSYSFGADGGIGGGSGGGSGGGGTGGGSGSGSGGGSGGGSGSGSGGGTSGLAGLGQTTGLDTLLDPVGAVTVGDTTLLGQGATPDPLGVSVLSPTTTPGSVATVGVLSGGQVLTVNTGQPNAPVTAATGPANGLLGLTVGDKQVVGSSSGNPAIDLNVLSPTGASGTAVTGNILSNGQPLGLGVTQPEGTGGLLGGVTGTVGGLVGGATSNPQGLVEGVTGTVGGVVNGVTGTVGGLAPGVSAGGGLGLGGVLNVTPR